MHSVGASYLPNKPRSSKASKCLNRFFRFLTWSSGYPKYLQYLFLIASNLQYILLLLHLQLRHFDSGQNSGLTLTVNQICKALLLRNLTNSHLDGWVVTVYIYLLSLLIGTCFLAYMAVRNYKISRMAKHAILTISQFHLSIAFWFCNAILLYSLTTAKDYHIKFFESSLDQSGLVSWHILLLLLNLLISGIISMYSYDPLKWSNDVAMSTPIPQILTFVFKGVVCLLLLLVNEGTSQKWLLALFSLIILGFRHFHLMTRFPYYEHQPLRLSLLMSSVAVLTSLLSILILCFHKIESLNGNAIFYMEAFLVSLGVKFSDTCFENKVVEYLTTSSLKSEDDVLKKIFALYSTRKNLRLTVSQDDHFSLKEIQFWGIWPSESDHISSFSEKTKVTQEEMDAGIYELLTTSIEKFKENKKLKFFLANFILHQSEGMLKGLDYLQQLRRSQGGFNRVRSAMLWEEYQKKLQNKYEGNLDIKTFLQFEESSRKFVEMIYSNSKRYVDFWKTYTRPSLDLMDLVHQSEGIEQNDQRIIKFWNNFEFKEKHLQKEFLILYIVYLSIIRNAKYAASKLRKKLVFYEKSFGHNNLEGEERDELTPETLMSSENLAFHVSMEKENFGKILYVSENAGRKLGWKKNEILLKTLEMMLPKFIRKERMQIMRGGDGKTLKDPRFNKVIDCFFVNSGNWVIPCHGFYCLYPKIKEELKVLALFRMKNFHEEMLFISHTGIILGATERIGQLLGLQGMMEKSSLEDICPGVYKAIFNEKRMKLSFNLKGDKDKLVLKECSISIEESGLKEKYWILKFSPEDVLKAQKQNKSEINKLQFQQITEEFDQEQEEIPSERLEWTMNSPLSSAKNLLINQLKCASRPEENFEMPTTPLKGVITTAGEPDDLLIATKKYLSESSVLKEEEEKILRRYQSRTSEEYMKDASIISSQASSQRIELEEVLHIMPKDNSMRAVNGLFRLYIFVAILLLIIFKVLHAESTNTVTNNTTISTAALLRLMRICNMYSQAGSLIRLDEGTIFANRYAFVGMVNLKYSIINGMPAIATNLLDSNNQLRQYVAKIEEKFYKNLYTELPMYLLNSSGAIIGNQTTNPFDLVNQLVARSDKIVHTLFPLISADVMFIYKNSMDKLLVLSEEGLSVISDDTDAKLNNLFNMTTYFLVVMGVIGLAFFCFFIYVVNQVVKDQEKTFELFRRLDEQGIVNYMKTVESFCSIMQHSDMNIQLAAKEIQQQDFWSDNFTTKPAVFPKGKRLHKKGVYNTLVQIVLVVLILLLVVFSGYIIILVLVNSQNDAISTKVNLLVSFNYQAYEHSLLKFVFPEYVGGHLNMTFRSQPFMQEWKETYKRNLDMGNSLLQIIDPEKGFGEDEMLVELVNGDLCEVIVTDTITAVTALVGNPCDKMLGGLARKGVKGVYDYGMYWMDLSLSNFEASNRAKIDSIKALNTTEQRQFEMLGLLYVRTAVEKISNRMEAQLQKDAEKFIHSMLVVVVVYVVIYATVVLVIWHKVQKVFSVQE